MISRSRVLLERVTDIRSAADRRPLKISSRTTVEPSLCADGYYYVPRPQS